MAFSENVSLPAFLKSWREKRGITLGKLAKQCGLSRATLSRWESGTHTPRATELARVMQALEVPHKEQNIQLRNYAPALVAGLSSPSRQKPLALGDALYALRLRSGLTQAEAARLVGVTQSLLSRWERGTSLPGDAQCHSLCFHLGASVDEVTMLTTRNFAEDTLPDDPDELINRVRVIRGHDPYDDKELSYLAIATKLANLIQRGKAHQNDMILVWAEQSMVVFIKYENFSLAYKIIERGLDLLRKTPGPISAVHVPVIALAYCEDFWSTPQRLGQNMNRLRGVEEWLGRSMEPVARAYYLNTVASAASKVDKRYTLRLLDEVTEVIAGHPVEFPLRMQNKARYLAKIGEPAKALEVLGRYRPLEDDSGWHAGMWELTRAEAYAMLRSRAEAERSLAKASAALLPQGAWLYRDMIDNVARILNVP